MTDRNLPLAVTFSRYEEDVTSRKRTLVHLPYVRRTTYFANRSGTFDREQFELMSDAEVLRSTFTEHYQVGDQIVFLNKAWARTGAPPRVLFGTLVDVTIGPLTIATGDLPKLNADTEAVYIERWNTLFPTMEAAMRPIVWRLEWAYGAIPSEAGIDHVARSITSRFDNSDPTQNP